MNYKVLACVICASISTAAFAKNPPEGTTNTDGIDERLEVQEENTVELSKFVLQQNGDMYEMIGDSVIRVYRCVFDAEKDEIQKNNPADSVYNHKWINEWVNPYKIDPNSLPDSIVISCDGYKQPVDGVVTSNYGWRWSRMHYGTDIGLHTGDSVKAAWAGKVRVVGWDGNGYGNYVVVRHDNGFETLYGHLSYANVIPNQHVEAGQTIGLGGSTGRSTGPHLHFEIRYLGNAFDPATLCDFEHGTLKKDSYVITHTCYKTTNSASTSSSSSASRSVSAAKKYTPKPVYHSVKAGETLSAIARKNGTTVSAICKLNRISETKLLQIGQKLRVK